ncbi:hypothetical protein RM543_08295 [Roseicyclus sp. F158]|uniref:Uncharacterized protein n=1 Tax=Tropicimonas omnivorans TaxID=3075590 RepID=A0ABU3DG58_9RHOB|nr:hypothetical protein [Roseicyclus sp. F158]MDT0682683.1 hypothetical protein [Roseicyclus sp. F158]
MRPTYLAIAIAIASVAVPLPASAQMGAPRPAQTPCLAATGEPENCVRILACIGDDGRWFDGRATGWNSGAVTGRTSDGVSCTGTWGIEPSGIGRAELFCEDGTAASVLSRYQDYETGTTIGEGLTGEGETIRTWSGENVLDFLLEDGTPTLPCGGDGVDFDRDGIPIS